MTASGAYYPEAEHKTGSSHFSGVNGIYDGAKAVVEFDVAYTLPFLRGNDEFTKENHIVFNTGLEVTPVSVAPEASITVSPIAFLEFAIGGTVGTGWNIGDLFQGMAKYEAAKPEYKDMTPFAHWYVYGWASACLMFDLADFEARRSFREKYKDVEHEPMMTYCGREWIFYGLGIQWKHLF